MERYGLARRLFLYWCWVPATAWAAVLFHLQGVNRAGGVVHLSLLIIPAAASAASLIAGVAIIVLMARAERQIDLLVALGTLLAGSPVLSYLLRHFARG